MAPPPTSLPGQPPEPPFLQVPDELLQDIFLRLPTAADLARASSACAAFRRVIADHKFLRCYRALHPPPLVGVIDNPFIPAQPPHPSAAAAARAFAGFDFSCSTFLPSTSGRRWRPLDFFEGRALLTGGPVDEDESDIRVFAEHEGSDLRYDEFLVRDLAVCDPVHRRYVLLPAVPDDLTALIHKSDFLDMKTFLAPGEDDGDPLSFGVLCMAQHRNKLVLLVFSSLGGQWRALTFDRSNDQELASLLQCKPFLSDHQYVHGRFYWQLLFPHKLLVLDVRVMEFSALDLPPEEQNSRFVIVEAAQGMLGMLSICLEA